MPWGHHFGCLTKAKIMKYLGFENALFSLIILTITWFWGVVLEVQHEFSLKNNYTCAKSAAPMIEQNLMVWRWICVNTATLKKHTFFLCFWIILACQKPASHISLDVLRKASSTMKIVVFYLTEDKSSPQTKNVKNVHRKLSFRGASPIKIIPQKMN